MKAEVTNFFTAVADLQSHFAQYTEDGGQSAGAEAADGSGSSSEAQGLSVEREVAVLSQ